MSVVKFRERENNNSPEPSQIFNICDNYKDVNLGVRHLPHPVEPVLLQDPRPWGQDADPLGSDRLSPVAGALGFRVLGMEHDD